MAIEPVWFWIVTGAHLVTQYWYCYIIVICSILALRLVTQTVRRLVDFLSGECLACFFEMAIMHNNFLYGKQLKIILSSGLCHLKCFGVTGVVGNFFGMLQ